MFQKVSRIGIGLYLLRAQADLACLIVSVNPGISLSTSATAPYRAASKIGARSSVLIAISVSQSGTPSICSGAPLMPSARYSLGFTALPDLPTRRDVGSQPLSTIGREADTAPPSAAANVSASLRLSCC